MSKEEKTVKTEASQKVPFFTKVIFWIAFAALLATSIPHVAWIYQVFEPQGSNTVDLWILQIDTISLTTYGIAIGIDVMAAWLTYTITLGGRRGNKSLWVFITVLVAFSWYCNYVYAMGHNPSFNKADIWSMPLAFGWTTTGQITPLLISAVPVLVIAYTVMWQQIGKPPVEDPVTMAEQAVRLEQLNQEKKRIRAAKREDRQDAMTGFFSDVKGTVGQATTLFKKDKSEAPEDVTGGETLEASAQATQKLAIPAQAPVKALISSVEVPVTPEVHTDEILMIRPSVLAHNDLNGHTEKEAPTLLETLASGNGHDSTGKGQATFVPPYRRTKQ